nr:hypothetical protein [Tanacetum cinerariifolium]
VVEKECDKKENSKVIAPGIFKLNVSQCVSPISMSKSSCDSKNVEIKLKRKRHLNTFSSVRRPRHRDVIWKKKGSSNTYNVGFSDVSVLNLNKNVKRSSRKDFSESENQSENDFLVVEKECDKKENSKVIAPGMFRLNMSQCVSPISKSKSLCESNNVEIMLKRKRRKRKSSKQNVKQVDNDASRANNDFVHFSDLDIFSSDRRPKNSGVI